MCRTCETKITRNEKNNELEKEESFDLNKKE